MPESLPFDITALGEAAAALHELFKTFIQAGFTEDQALKLIAYNMVAQAQAAKEDEEESNGEST